MANIYWAGEKADKKETKKALTKELVDCTDGAFAVRFESDGAGHHVVAYVERDTQGEFEWKKCLPPKFMGWRIVKIFVPYGYIGAILDSRED